MIEPNVIIDAAFRASEKHSKINESRLAFRVGYLEGSIYELCNLLKQANEIMQEQKNLITRMEKGSSASL